MSDFYPRKEGPKGTYFDVTINLNCSISDKVFAHSRELAITQLITKCQLKGLNPEINIAYAELQDEFGNVTDRYLIHPPDIERCVLTEDGLAIPLGEPDFRRENHEELE